MIVMSTIECRRMCSVHRNNILLLQFNDNSIDSIDFIQIRDACVEVTLETFQWPQWTCWPSFVHSPKYEHNVNVKKRAEIIMRMASHAGMVSEMEHNQSDLTIFRGIAADDKSNLRLYCKLCMHTLLSTDMDRTAASVLLDIGGPSVLFDGKNSNPVTNIKWADGMCKTRCRLNAM